MLVHHLQKVAHEQHALADRLVDEALAVDVELRPHVARRPAVARHPERDQRRPCLALDRGLGPHLLQHRRHQLQEVGALLGIHLVVVAHLSP